MSNNERKSSPKNEGRRSAGKRIQPWPRHAIGCCHLMPLRAQQRSLTGTARLSALRRGTRQGERIRLWLSSRPALPETKVTSGVTRLDLSAVYRAPRGPVVVPAGRGPRAARERFARPRAGTALAPQYGWHPECTLHERDSKYM
jgi:hypothetical protein